MSQRPDHHAALQSLVEYHLPFCTEHFDDDGVITLLTPQVNVLALNATYGLARSGPTRTRLVACTSALLGQPVSAVRVGLYAPQPADSEVVVEQVSRLQLAQWSEVLAQAYDTPQWATALARHFALKLEADPHSVLLLAYDRNRAVGTLLWRNGAAHLWGTLDHRADVALLNAATFLGGMGLVVSLPEGCAVQLPDAQVVNYTLRDG